MKLKSTHFIIILIASVFACAQDKNPVNTKHFHEVIVKDINNP